MISFAVSSLSSSAASCKVRSCPQSKSMIENTTRSRRIVNAARITRSAGSTRASPEISAIPVSPFTFLDFGEDPDNGVREISADRGLCKHTHPVPETHSDRSDRLITRSLIGGMLGRIARISLQGMPRMHNLPTQTRRDAEPVIATQQRPGGEVDLDAIPAAE